ncbi:MAG: acyltransferase [Zoogloeaceae bacterium]|nr:acyltransferase [Rhodocyclaceae bacterium]MCP5237407.1 acyltransferase [Zoogloeaceae bacterium]
MTTGFHPDLHGLRGIAALSVLLFHWNYHFPQWLPVADGSRGGLADALSLVALRGWVGVPLFFVLAGYLLAAQLRTSDLTAPAILRFWVRRGLRIYPAYWLQLAMLATLGAGFAAVPPLDGWITVRDHVLLWLNLPPTMTRPLNGVWWTLPIELGFYLLLPALMLSCRRFGWLATYLFALLVSITWRAGVIAHLALDNYGVRISVIDALPGSLAVFAAGMAAAHLTAPRSAAVRFGIVITAGVVLHVLLGSLEADIRGYWAGGWQLVILPSAIGIALALTLPCLIVPTPALDLLATRPMVVLGELSYGIYLWHFPVQRELRGLLPADWLAPWPLAGCLLIALLATLALAWVSHRLIERPVMRWSHRRMGGQRDHDAPD